MRRHSFGLITTNDAAFTEKRARENACCKQDGKELLSHAASIVHRNFLHDKLRYLFIKVLWFKPEMI
jgi:hypothetical protein